MFCMWLVIIIILDGFLRGDTSHIYALGGSFIRICQYESLVKADIFTEMLISVLKALNNIHVQLLPHKKLHIEKYCGPFCFATPTNPMVTPLRLTGLKRICCTC